MLQNNLKVAYLMIDVFNQTGPNTDVNTDDSKPTPPVTPNTCDPNLVLDAVTMLRGEILFFKDR